MACVSNTYNCTVTWRVENLSVFLNQPRDDFCTPTGEVETYNTSKWRMTLKKVKKDVVFVLGRTDGKEEKAVDLRVSVVGTDGRTNFSVYKTGFDFKSESDEVRMTLTSVEELRAHKDYLIPKDYLKVRVEARLCHSTNQELKTSFTTVIKVEKCFFTWTLKDTSGLQEENNSSFPLRVHLNKSPDFTLVFSVPRLGQEACLKVARKSGEEEDVCDLLMSCSLTVPDFYGIYHNADEWVFFDSSINSKNVKTPYIDYSRLDRIDLSCKFAFADGSCGSIHEAANYSIPTCENTNQVVVEQSPIGKSLYKDKKFADVTLKAGNKEFKAHKAILSNASPVFNSLLEKQKANPKGVIDIELDPDVLKQVLKFAYTNKIEQDLTFKDLDELYSAAHKYVVKKLKAECAARLEALMSIENVSRILHLAYEYDDDVLKKASKALFCKHSMDILESKEWEKFMNSCIQRKMSVMSSTTESGPFSFTKLRASMRRIRTSSKKTSPEKSLPEPTPVQKKEEKKKKDDK